MSFLEAGKTVIGIDEVGRGAWAGPVVAGAVVLSPYLMIDGVNDSKLVSATRRHQLYGIIKSQALAYGLGWVEPAEVDEFGLSWAVAESGRRALAGIDLSNAIIVLDGTWNYLSDTHNSVAIVKADSLVMPVAAASIIAKVARDNHMAELAVQYPGYGFERHVGYGTKVHQAALAQLGISPAHRRSYKPVQSYVND